jgi:Domain of unknown function (DUF4337)
MAEDEIHVHGAHEHAVEHAAHAGISLAQQVAIFTAILATVGALVSYRGGSTQNDAMLYKNEAVLKKAEASDQWNFYQAKSGKQHLMEVALELVPAEKQARYRKEITRYEQEKSAIKAKAEALDEESKKANEQSEQFQHPHHRLAQGLTLIQIAISLASITVLTNRRWLFVLGGVAAVGGLAFAALSFFA